eukprot:TRINITY_DN11997_c0_g1_i2.p1 TRINITY_DN11997_c0_g1~~TRINITY_DN11997_c0_g1_i2.p1  ORF type:complete len:320 (-),score=74.60 TRINITY_DN11997_c0_g1_i2:130-1089(-)
MSPPPSYGAPAHLHAFAPPPPHSHPHPHAYPHPHPHPDARSSAPPSAYGSGPPGGQQWSQHPVPAHLGYGRRSPAEHAVQSRTVARRDVAPRERPALADKRRDNGAEESEDESSEEDAEVDPDARLSTEEAFVRCFADDMLSGTPLLLSRLDNLYRMRSGGATLACSNSEKRLNEYLQDMDGLVLHGEKNQMEVRLEDRTAFAAYAKKVEAALTERIAARRRAGESVEHLDIAYEKPQVLPQQLKDQLLELMRSLPGRECRVGALAGLFAERFQPERLHCRQYGFHDVKGLMAQLPFVEKVGNRREAKFRLKASAADPA